MKTIITFLLASVIPFMVKAYTGDGTYYGAGGAGEKGSCMLPRYFNGVTMTVAMNKEQYDNGMACGKCVVIRGEGIGLGTKPIIGPIYATIDNECPECKFGDVDLGMDGDGRFLIEWDFIPCEEVPSHFRRRLRVG
jgi:hypothetical protein